MRVLKFALRGGTLSTKEFSFLFRCSEGQNSFVTGRDRNLSRNGEDGSLFGFAVSWGLGEWNPSGNGTVLHSMSAFDVWQWWRGGPHTQRDNFSLQQEGLQPKFIHVGGTSIFRWKYPWLPRDDTPKILFYLKCLLLEMHSRPWVYM